MPLLWLEFIVLAGVIVLSGTLLSKWGDVIAQKTRLGGAWIGVLFVAAVTSFPELFNGISSVTIADVPDITVGDIMGSLLFNLTLLTLMDALLPVPLFSKAGPGHTLSAGFAIILAGLVVVSKLSGDSLPSIGHIGWYTPLIILVYLIGIRSIFLFEKRREGKGVDPGRNYDHLTLREAVLKFSAYSVVIITAATLLPFIGDRIAAETGLGRSFVGTFFIGVTTSMPELVVSIAAVRMGAVDMAVADIFGSNMFDIIIIAVDDIFYTKGPILLDVSESHVLTGFLAILMTGIAVVGLAYRPRKKLFLRLGMDTLFIALAYVMSVIILYAARGS